MEAINHAMRQRGYALDHLDDHTPAMPNATALYAKLMSYQNELESYSPLPRSYAQKGDAGAATQERQSRSRARANGNRGPAMVAVNMNGARLGHQGQGTAVLVVSDARIGDHSHLDLDDAEDIATTPLRFAFPLPPSFPIEQHNDLLAHSNRAKSRRAAKTPSPPPPPPPYHLAQPSLQPLPRLHKSHRSPARMATVVPTVGSTLVAPQPIRHDRFMPPPTASEVSEVQLDGFAEGEVLDTELSDAWPQHSPYHYQKILRDSSSTLFDETQSRPPSRLQKFKDDGQTNSGDTYNLPMKPVHKLGDATTSSANSPNWMTSARSKVEPSTPSRGKNSNADSGVESAQGSPSLSKPTTPSTPPAPAEVDKTTKNLAIFNRIPRQWPASQETLHQRYLDTAIPPTIDPATAERIERARERLAAVQREDELKARGFFNHELRYKGPEVYPAPGNWVYCRRTKNNWLDKTKIIADQYKLFKGQVLGKGHHADVYKGIDLATGQDLAIKVVYKTVSRRLGIVREDQNQSAKNRRLLNEAYFIDHLKAAPGICKLLKVVETATKYYFVMELAESDLNSYSNGINMREEEIRHILKPIFECLKYAHSKEVTHRDIKPENILLKTRKDWMPNTASKLKSRSSKHTLLNSDHPFHCNDDRSSINSTYMDADDSSIDLSTISNYDQRFEATLADWGLAVEHDANSGRKPVGTPLYAAPEVVRKMKRVRRRKENFINYRACDIWSLGVTMFVIASGIYPYHTHDLLESQSQPNWQALQSSGMSREYIAFTQRLMNLNAEDRPSAAEACDDAWLRG